MEWERLKKVKVESSGDMKSKNGIENLIINKNS